MSSSTVDVPLIGAVKSVFIVPGICVVVIVLLISCWCWYEQLTFEEHAARAAFDLEKQNETQRDDSISGVRKKLSPGMASPSGRPQPLVRRSSKSTIGVRVVTPNKKSSNSKSGEAADDVATRAPLSVGDVVTWQSSDQDLPQGTKGVVRWTFGDGDVEVFFAGAPYQKLFTLAEARLNLVQRAGDATAAGGGGGGGLGVSDCPWAAAVESLKAVGLCGRALTAVEHAFVASRVQFEAKQEAAEARRGAGGKHQQEPVELPSFDDVLKLDARETAREYYLNQPEVSLLFRTVGEARAKERQRKLALEHLQVRDSKSSPHELNQQHFQRGRFSAAGKTTAAPARNSLSFSESGTKIGRNEKKAATTASSSSTSSSFSVASTSSNPTKTVNQDDLEASLLAASGKLSSSTPKRASSQPRLRNSASRSASESQRSPLMPPSSTNSSPGPKSRSIVSRTPSSSSSSSRSASSFSIDRPITPSPSSPGSGSKGSSGKFARPRVAAKGGGKGEFKSSDTTF